MVSRNYSTTVRGPRRSSTSNPSVTPWLVVLHGPGELPRPLELRAGEATLGRGDATISLPNDPRLSRVHATILVSEAGEVQLHDASVNGTFVNGHLVKDAELRDGDLIRVGDWFLLIRDDFGEPSSLEPLPGYIGRAPVARALAHHVRLVAANDAPVLVIGETGTGKELVARAIHQLGERAGPFVAINCAAIPDNLVESELFGHAAGAFTGATRDHLGVFRSAHGGTLLLDEIGELSLATQAKLLRALEERAVRPIGRVNAIAFDVRVIAATNRDLRSAVDDGSFRADLFARLDGLEIRTPPLRERREDVLLLLARMLGEGSPPLAADLVDALLLHDWPFNVRELANVATELRVRGIGAQRLEPELVAARLERRLLVRSAPIADPVRAETVAPPTRDELVALFETHRGVIADVARATGRSRKQVYRWARGHGIDVEAFRTSK